LRAQVRVDTEGRGIEQIVDVIVSGLELNSSKEK
jgi:hypothetical protein